MKVAVARETFPGELRVALTPNNIPALNKAGVEVIVEPGAGQRAGFLDDAYLAKGAKLAASRDALFDAEILVQVRAYGSNPEAGRSDLGRLRPGQIVIGMCDPLGAPERLEEFARTGAALFALELIPRITRAQSMDVLSSMATIAGYRAVLLAAVELPKMFPMMMTAAGTLIAAKVFVIGAGVAGLQAMATARKLGAVVQGYDVRPTCKDQVESVGAKFVALPLEVASAEGAGGYAKAQNEEFYAKQRELLADVVAQNDVVITTAAIPGRKSPLLVTKDAVSRMHTGSVIVDLAAERGGNCDCSRPNERVVANGVVILGPTNLPSEVPTHASQMYSNNVTKFLLNLVQDGQVQWNLDDPILRDTLVVKDGERMQGRQPVPVN